MYDHFEIVIKTKEEYDKVLVKFKELGIITGDYSKEYEFYRCSNDINNIHKIDWRSKRSYTYLSPSDYGVNLSLTAAQFLNESTEYELW